MRSYHLFDDKLQHVKKSANSRAGTPYGVLKCHKLQPGVSYGRTFGGFVATSANYSASKASITTI
ncbi:hypothetical protein Hanom_Chr09g00857441 [Helianthus anomalus]